MTSKNDVSDSFYTKFLQGIGAPVTALNLQWLKNWHSQELSDALHNAFDTTQVEPGSSPMDGNPNGNNGHPVQNYTTEDQGLQANLTTIKNPRYAGIVAALKANDQLGASEQLVSSAWGTHTITDPETKQKVTGSGTPGSAKETGGPSYQPLIPSSVTQGISDALTPSGWIAALKGGLPPNFLVRSGEIVGGGLLMVVGVIAVAETLGASGVAKAAIDTASHLVPEAKAAKVLNPKFGKDPRPSTGVPKK